MRIEPLSTANLREGIFCGGKNPNGELMFSQMEAWLQGDMLRGQVAYTDSGDVAGFVLYYPIERAPLEFEGEGFYMVQCLLVKPAFELQGFGSGLIAAAMRDASEYGAVGLAAQGFSPEAGDVYGPVPGSFFERMGMHVVESRGHSSLYFSRIKPGGRQPAFMNTQFKPPAAKDRLRVDILDCRNCYSAVRNVQVAKKVLDDLGDAVEVHVHDQNSRSAVVDKGMATGVFIDGNLTFFGRVTRPADIMSAFEAAMAAKRMRTDR